MIKLSSEYVSFKVNDKGYRTMDKIPSYIGEEATWFITGRSLPVPLISGIMEAAESNSFVFIVHVAITPMGWLPEHQEWEGTSRKVLMERNKGSKYAYR
jgi:hypothetical protein